MIVGITGAVGCGGLGGSVVLGGIPVWDIARRGCNLVVGAMLFVVVGCNGKKKWHCVSDYNFVLVIYTMVLDVRVDWFSIRARSFLCFFCVGQVLYLRCDGFLIRARSCLCTIEISGNISK